MITNEEMKTMITENKGVWLKTSPNDVVEKYWDYEKAIADIPVDLRDDVAGWEKSGIGYKPVFATKQAMWDTWMEEFRGLKGSWCRKNGCK